MSVQGYKETLIKLGEDGTTVSRAYTGKTCRVVRNAYTEYFEEHRDELQPFPAQIGRAVREGAFHMGGNLETPGVDPNKEFYPAGQGVGGIKQLVPAGDIVHSMVAEAEEILAKPRTLVG
jgi:enoyl-[acyl-carrier protein] reductase II